MGAAAREQSARRGPREAQKRRARWRRLFQSSITWVEGLTFKRVLARLFGTLCVHPNGRSDAAIHSVEPATTDFTFA